MEKTNDILKFDVYGNIITGSYISDTGTQIFIKVISDSLNVEPPDSEISVHKDFLID